jgi:CBS-domain-containing membrane protein
MARAPYGNGARQSGEHDYVANDSHKRLHDLVRGKAENVTVLRTIRVKDYMTRRLTTLAPDTGILQAVQTLIKSDISSAPVVNKDGVMIGILTEKDCMQVVLNACYHSEYGGTVADFMTTEVETMNPEDTITDAARCFLDKRYHRYPVMDNDRLVGVISRRDLLRALGESW